MGILFMIPGNNFKIKLNTIHKLYRAFIINLSLLLYGNMYVCMSNDVVVGIRLD